MSEALWINRTQTRAETFYDQHHWYNLFHTNLQKTVLSLSFGGKGFQEGIKRHDYTVNLYMRVSYTQTPFNESLQRSVGVLHTDKQLWARMSKIFTGGCDSHCPVFSISIKWIVKENVKRLCRLALHDAIRAQWSNAMSLFYSKLLVWQGNFIILYSILLIAGLKHILICSTQSLPRTVMKLFFGVMILCHWSDYIKVSRKVPCFNDTF